jgi:hypothetical protein
MIKLNRSFLCHEKFTSIAPDGMWCDGDDSADYVVSGNCYEWYFSYPMRLRRIPSRVLEIGIRYGYSAVALMMGSLHRSRFVEYWGFDDGSYGVDPLEQIGRIESMFEPGSVGLLVKKINTQKIDRMSDVIGLFDIIHIDALHTADGEAEAHDLRLVAPLLQDGGIIIVDDATDGRTSMMELIPRVGDEIGMRWVYAPTFRGNVVLFKGELEDTMDVPDGSVDDPDGSVD